MIVSNIAEYEQRAVSFALGVVYRVVNMNPLAIRYAAPPPVFQNFHIPGSPDPPSGFAPPGGILFSPPLAHVPSPFAPLQGDHYRPFSPAPQFSPPPNIPTSIAVPTGPLADLRHSLFLHRHRMPLFDTLRWTRNLEKGLEEAWRRWVVGTEFLLSREWMNLPEGAPERRSTAIWVTDARPFMPSDGMSGSGEEWPS